MSKPACKSCRFFDVFDNDTETGMCRHSAPMAVHIGRLTENATYQKYIYRGLWPVTRAGDWCGDYERSSIQKS